MVAPRPPRPGYRGACDGRSARPPNDQSRRLSRPPRLARTAVASHTVIDAPHRTCLSWHARDSPTYLLLVSSLLPEARRAIIYALSSAPEVFESMRRQLGVADRMLDILVAEVRRQRAGIVAGTGEGIAATVPKHVRKAASGVRWVSRGPFKLRPHGDFSPGPPAPPATCHRPPWECHDGSVPRLSPEHSGQTTPRKRGGGFPHAVAPRPW
jgi:hypothetical protein